MERGQKSSKFQQPGLQEQFLTHSLLSQANWLLTRDIGHFNIYTHTANIHWRRKPVGLNTRLRYALWSCFTHEWLRVGVVWFLHCLTGTFHLGGPRLISLVGGGYHNLRSIHKTQIIIEWIWFNEILDGINNCGIDIKLDNALKHENKSVFTQATTVLMTTLDDHYYTIVIIIITTKKRGRQTHFCLVVNQFDSMK